MIRLYLPVGAAGSGKSSLARSLVERGHLPAEGIVSPDDLRVVMTGARSDQSANGSVFRVAHLIVHERLAHGLDTWLDATNLPIPLEPVEDALIAGAQVVVVPFFCRPEVLAHRNEMRRIGGANDVPDDVLARQIARFEEEDRRKFRAPFERLGPAIIDGLYVTVPSGHLVRWLENGVVASTTLSS